MNPHRESTKRESRIRVGTEIRDLPTDVHTRLAEETTAYRYPTQWNCAVYALSIGLIVMRLQRDRLGEIVNALEQTGTGTR
jgi:hypothetical protein